MTGKPVKNKQQARDQIKLVTLDFDGTLLMADQVSVSQANMTALMALAREGIHLVPCSGRCAAMFPPQIEAEAAFRYWVSSGGARVIDRERGRCLHSACFSPEESARLLELIDGQGLYAEVAAEGHLYVEESICMNLQSYPVPAHHRWYMESDRPRGIRGKLSEYFWKEQLEIEKINIYGVPEDKQGPLWQQLSALPFVRLIDSTPQEMQIFCRRTHRLRALGTLLDHLGLGLENVMSFGDSLAMDGELLASAGLGIAMGNGPEALHAMAADVTAPFQEDGVARAIEKWLL